MPAPGLHSKLVKYSVAFGDAQGQEEGWRWRLFLLGAQRLHWGSSGAGAGSAELLRGGAISGSEKLLSGLGGYL